MAFDGTDAGALDRRMAVREDHLALGAQLAANGQLLYATAILDDADKMIGSMEVVNFPNHDDVDKYLENEPYVTGKVWETIDVRPCRPGPAFQPATSN